MDPTVCGLLVRVWCALLAGSRLRTNPRPVTWGFIMERVTRIELALSAWEAAGIWWPFRALSWAGVGERPCWARLLSPWFPAVPRSFWCASGAHRAHPSASLLGSGLLAGVGAVPSGI